MFTPPPALTESFSELTALHDRVCRRSLVALHAGLISDVQRVGNHLWHIVRMLKIALSVRVLKLQKAAHFSDCFEAVLFVRIYLFKWQHFHISNKYRAYELFSA